MGLNLSKGNMYGFVTHTWNVVKGKCPHDCSYCYMKRFKQNPVRFDKKELKTDLGRGNFIFVGSSCDMWAEEIEDQWIIDILTYCKNFPHANYLFQTKNPERMFDLRFHIPYYSVLGTTIETNREYEEMGKAPPPTERAAYLNILSREWRTMVTVEPIMDFDINELIALVNGCHPEWVNIGADSKGHGLPEPSREKIIELIAELKKTVSVKIKENLNRLR